MVLQLPFIVLSLLLLAIGIATELAAALLDVELTLLAEAAGMTVEMFEAAIYGGAIVAAGLGIVVLRILPRSLAPLGAVGAHERHLADPDQPRVAHVNDPLQSVYVAVIMIASVLLFSTVS